MIISEPSPGVGDWTSALSNHESPPHPDPEPTPFRPPRLGSHLPRQFGGVGLMIEKPGLEVVAEPARDWEANGPLSGRVLEITRSVATRLKILGFPVEPIRLTTVSGRKSMSAWESGLN